MYVRSVLLLALIPAFIACGKNSGTSAALPDETGLQNPDIDLITPEIRAKGIATRALGWSEPTYPPDEEARVLEQYQYMDPNKEIPAQLLKKTLLYYHRNRDLITNQKYVMIIDMSPHSRKYRMFMLNLTMGTVGAMRTSHGKGSDVDDDGYAEQFSNVSESNMTTLGFFVTGETYRGKNGYSLRIDGISETNSLTRDRAIVIHGGNYVKDDDVKQGRSLGCFVLSWDNRKYVIDRIHDGVLMYAGLSRE